MTISVDLYEQVRRRANYVCEYCGVRESDVGGELTIDHFQPQSTGGTDDLTNLLYCCFRCNLYKADYWPIKPTDPSLWHPRGTARETQLILLPDGILFPITPAGEFTLRRLRLNRRPLVDHRNKELEQFEEKRLLTRLNDLLTLLEQLQQQQAELLQDQRTLLQEHRTWLDFLKNLPK